MEKHALPENYAWEDSASTLLNFVSEYKVWIFIFTFFAFLLIFHWIFVYFKLRSKKTFKIIDYVWLLIAAIGFLMAIENRSMQARIDELTRTKLIAGIETKSMFDRIKRDRNLFCNWRDHIFNTGLFQTEDHTKFCKYIFDTENIFLALESEFTLNTYLSNEANYAESMVDDGALRARLLNPSPSQYLSYEVYLEYEESKRSTRLLVEHMRRLAKESFESRYLYILSVFWGSVFSIALALRMTKTTGEIRHDEMKS